VFFLNLLMDLPLRNPYKTTYHSIEEQPVEESFCNYDLDFDHIEYNNGGEVGHPNLSLDHLDAPFEVDDPPPRTVSSLNEESQHSVKSNQLSGVHEKYLSCESSPLPRKNFQSERKLTPPFSSSVYGKRMKKTKLERPV
jgi:hypothetical protein